MRTRWFADPAEGERLDGRLLRLVGAVSRMLDRRQSPAVAPGTGLVDAAAAAVVLPHAGIPGCSLVVQVAEWSSSVGCWWTAGTDPRSGPVALELSAELPLQPDGLAKAVAWLDRELRRPVAARARSYGVVRRREWAVVMDDGYELPVHHRWLPGWRDLDEGGSGPPGMRSAAGGAAPAGARAGPGAWLLRVAVAAAAGRWVLAAVSPELIGLRWVDSAARVLDAAAFAALFVWFVVAAHDRPARLRVPMLAGLLLATLAAALALLPGPIGPPSATDPAGRTLGLFLHDAFPSLLGATALACYLVAFLGLPPGRPGPRPPWPRVLPVAAGLAWGIDLAVGLLWMAQVEPTDPAGTPPAWYGVLASVTRAAALALAVVLVFVLLDRRPSLPGRAARSGLAGGVLMVVAWSVALQLGTSLLFALVPRVAAFAALGAAVVVAWFAGTALLAVAAAEPVPQPPSTAEGSPSPSVATARRRNPIARPNWSE